MCLPCMWQQLKKGAGLKFSRGLFELLTLEPSISLFAFFNTLSQMQPDGPKCPLHEICILMAIAQPLYTLFHP
jgi:hypothetical protein